MYLAGCPATSREWIIKPWLKHLSKSADAAEIDLEMLLVVPEHDFLTRDAFMEGCSTYDLNPHVIDIVETPREDIRQWGMSRYEVMAELRNTMLEAVRDLQPDWFLSVDSDILLGEDVLTRLSLGLDSFDAIGGKTWLSATNIDIVNYANMGRNNQLKRANHVGVIPVDVLMAIKMMSPKAYSVDYRADIHGEDIGWSMNARTAGCSLGWDGIAVSKHCMSPADMMKIDKRVGW